MKPYLFATVVALALTAAGAAHAVGVGGVTLIDFDYYNDYAGGWDNTTICELPSCTCSSGFDDCACYEASFTSSGNTGGFYAVFWNDHEVELTNWDGWYWHWTHWDDNNTDGSDCDEDNNKLDCQAYTASGRHWIKETGEYDYDTFGDGDEMMRFTFEYPDPVKYYEIIVTKGDCS